VIEISAENFPAICKKYEISSVPAVLYFVGSKLVDRVVGVRLPNVMTNARLYVSLIYKHYKHMAEELWPDLNLKKFSLSKIN